MRESYRAKQSRKARINREKETKNISKKSNKSKNIESNNLKKIERNFELSQNKEYEDIISGRNAVLELLKSDKDINKIFIEQGEKHGGRK